MVKRQISARGVSDPRVLEALNAVPREEFVLPEMIDYAYHDRPLPIEDEQTISQPYIVGLMLDVMKIQPSDRVLEIGTGSGYAAAVLSRLAAKVYTVERIESLARGAQKRLENLGYSNVEVRHADGTLGWPEKAPFDAIVVAAGGSQIPQALERQLAPGARLVIPVGGEKNQSLLVVRRTGDNQFEESKIANVRFVPLIAGESQ